MLFRPVSPVAWSSRKYVWHLRHRCVSVDSESTSGSLSGVATGSGSDWINYSYARKRRVSPTLVVFGQRSTWAKPPGGVAAAPRAGYRRPASPSSGGSSGGGSSSYSGSAQLLRDGVSTTLTMIPTWVCPHGSVMAYCRGASGTETR